MHDLIQGKKPKTSIQPLLGCFNEVKGWLAANFLHLNDSKAEAVLFEPSGKGVSPTIDLASIPAPLSNVITELGVKLDSKLIVDAQVNSVRSCCFQQISELKSILSNKHLEPVVEPMAS